MKRSLPNSASLVFLSVLLATITTLAMSGCAVHFISNYDPVLDNDVTTLQMKTEASLDRLDAEAGTPAATYSKNTDFYTTVDAALRTMATRAASEPKSRIIVQEVQSIQKTFVDLRKLHQIQGEKGLSQANIRNSRAALETEFQALLTLELALKANSATSPTTAGHL